ncbi:MAG: ubiquinol-cytochrome c reductase iron-sulfur subunit [Hyphomicrobiales bacterium]|nr:ubiquinol-cytochrome c reductase iron-sulfur subunit [Hyphomicrobiales bacterium]
MTTTSKIGSSPASKEGETRRDFMVVLASATAGVGAVATVWPFIDSLNPAADVLALASTEVDISAVQPGQAITVMWRGKPVFIRRRTEQEITEAENTKLSDLPDPEKDTDRVKKGEEQWLVVVGVCTHLGCVPISNQGEYNGWFCPCHGSHYDISGRIRKGPAPKNLAVPPYKFTSETTILIG